MPSETPAPIEVVAAPPLPTTPEPNVLRVNWLRSVCLATRANFESFRAVGALVQDFIDSPELQALTESDFVAQFEGLTPADIQGFITAVATMDATLSANDGAFRKLFKRFAARGY